MDGKRWRIFMGLLRLGDLITSYTHEGPRGLASSWWISTSALPQDLRARAIWKSWSSISTLGDCVELAGLVVAAVIARLG